MRNMTHGECAFVCGRWPLDPDRSTLLFIHGAGESSLLWRAQVAGLAGRVNTLALDLPGHGRSAGGAKTTVADYARAVVDFIDAIALPGPIPCGLSMGGAITQALLLDYPGRFRSGIIVSSGAKLRVLPSLLETIERDMRAYVAMIDRFGFSPQTPPAVKQPFLEDSLRADPAVARGDFMACDGFDVMSRLDSIRVPVLIISGEDDRLTPPKYAAYLEEKIPRAARSHIRDAGHFIPVEQPQAVNRAIAEFLDAHGL